MPRIESSVGGFLETRAQKQSAPWRLQFLFFLPKIWRLLAVFCVCVTFGHLSSASRFVRACSVGAVHGVALHIVHVAKGRPLRLMRINGRSIIVRWQTGYTKKGKKYVLTMMFAAGHTVASYASFTSPLLTVDKHPSLR